MGGFVRNITGQTAAKRAAREANRGQQEAADRSLKLLQANTAPYRELGTDFLPQYSDFINQSGAMFTPEGQADYLARNPLLQQAQGVATEQINQRAAAGGKYNSGGAINEIFRQNALLANDFLNQGINQTMQRANMLYQPVQMGQNAATLQATQGGNIMTNAANAAGASTMAQGMMPSQTFNNLLQAGATGVGAFLGLSDERAKDILEVISEDAKGRIVRFKYKGSDEVYEGRIAQDLQKTDPDHVVEIDGILRVSDKYMPKRVS